MTAFTSTRCLLLILFTHYGLTETAEHDRRHGTDACPNALDISPCVCTNTVGLTINCSLVTDEEQLRNIFASHFPVSAFYKFVMWGNENIVTLENGVFGEVSFEVVDVRNSALTTVRSQALRPSFETLRQFKIVSSQLSLFPFELISNFSSLVDLNFASNDLYLPLPDPPMASSSLLYLDLSYNYITNIPHNLFSLLTAVTTIDLRGNKIMDFTQSTFTSIPRLSTLLLSDNIMSKLPASSVRLQPSGFLDLRNNYINTVEVDAFEGIVEPSQVNFSNNTLAMFEEDVWRPLLETDTTLWIQGNPLSCGCVVAWLVRNPHLLARLQDGACADGIPLADLNPQDYDACD